MNNNNTNQLDSELIVVSKKFDSDLTPDPNIKKDYKIVKDVYTYQSKSKLDQLPLWVKIIISCILIILAIGIIVGGAFAINAVSNIAPAVEPTSKIIEFVSC